MVLAGLRGRRSVVAHWVANWSHFWLELELVFWATFWAIFGANWRELLSWRIAQLENYKIGIGKNFLGEKFWRKILEKNFSFEPSGEATHKCWPCACV